jgi:hypothetical protein
MISFDTPPFGTFDARSHALDACSQDLDSALMATAETKGRKRGRIGAYVTSFRLQAAWFYKIHGHTWLAD